jgi:hypothetical protein
LNQSATLRDIILFVSIPPINWNQLAAKAALLKMLQGDSGATCASQSDSGLPVALGGPHIVFTSCASTSVLSTSTFGRTAIRDCPFAYCPVRSGQDRFRGDALAR